MKRYFWYWLACYIGLISTSFAQKIVVYEWEVINFNVDDTQKVTEMLRQRLSDKYDVVPHEKMLHTIEESNVIIPMRLESNDISRLTEIFEASYIVTGLLSQFENQFMVNVRLLDTANADTLVSITKNIQGNLLDPSQTFINEIAQQLDSHLPQQRTKQSFFREKKLLIGATAAIGGAVLTYLFWPKKESGTTTAPQLPRPPEFPK